MIRALFTKRAGLATLLTGLIVLIGAALVVLSFTNTASSWGNVQGEKAIKGEVVAVDNMRHLTMLSVRPNETGKFANEQMHIFLNPYTTAKICKATEPAKAIKARRDATIKYHELSGLAVADSVLERC